MAGHVHRTLELPEGYQHFSWYKQGPNPNGVYLNDVVNLRTTLSKQADAELRLYTQHQIFYEDDVLKHTRSSPNWDGGVVTFATCKHLMRTYKPDWVGTWISGLCPADCEANTILFVGCVQRQFPSNYELGEALKSKPAYGIKQALTNPRGDLYTLCKHSQSMLKRGLHYHNHTFYLPPENHTRSVEFYKKSPGSVSEREDGLIPKWWRDIEYIQHNTRPPVFILSPVFLFSKPMIWSSYKPGRAALKLGCDAFNKSLRTKP